MVLFKLAIDHRADDCTTLPILFPIGISCAVLPSSVEAAPLNDFDQLFGDAALAHFI